MTNEAKIPKIINVSSTDKHKKFNYDAMIKRIDCLMISYRLYIKIVYKLC